MDLGLRNVSMIRLYSECCGVSFHSEIRRPNWSFLIPDVRYGLSAGSCRVHLGWDCVFGRVIREYGVIALSGVQPQG